MLDNTVKIKIEQYTRCCEDIRHYDTGLWQITSINITVAGIMIGISFQFLSGIYRIIPLLLAFFLSLVLSVTLSKYILFQLGRAEFMHQIEREFEVEPVPTSTKEVLAFLNRANVEVDQPARWFKQRKANRWVIGIMITATIALFIMVLVGPFI